ILCPPCTSCYHHRLLHSFPTRRSSDLIDSPLQRMLNGLICTANTPGTPGHITFGNVPAGNHAVIVYLVGIPLQFQDGDYWSGIRSEEHTSELQSRVDIVCRLLLEKKKK